MRVRPRPPIRLLLVLQAEERTGRLVWRAAEGDRALLLAAGLVVGAEGQPESFLEYLARACGIPPTTLGRIERRVRDLFLPLESEVARTTGLALEAIAALRRDFTLAQVGELCLGESDPEELEFREAPLELPGAACQVPPATALADLLLGPMARATDAPVFPERPLRPTRLFPRLGGLLEAAFPWRIPLPQAGGETAQAILDRCGADRAAALYLLVAGGLLSEEPPPLDRRKHPPVVPGLVAAASGNPITRLATLEARLAEDPFNQEAIEAIERLAADEGWPELLVEMQERAIAKAPPPQRGYFYLRLAALADIAPLPPDRHAEIVLLGRRSLPRDVRLACAEAYVLFRTGNLPGAERILAAAGVTWPPAPGSRGAPSWSAPSSPELIVRPEPTGLGAAVWAANAAAARPVTPSETPTVVDLPPTTPVASGPDAPAPVVAVPDAPAAVVAPPAPAEAARVVTLHPAPAAPAPEQPPRDVADFSDVSPDPLVPLMTALQQGDDDTLHAWLRASLPELPRVRRASQAILDAAQGSDAAPKDHVARFARALGHALDEMEPPAAGSEQVGPRADLFVQLADLLAPIDGAAALVAAERAVATDPAHELATEKLERLAVDQRNADAYARGFALAEQRVEGAHNQWAFAYRQGRTLETEFGRPDLALAAYQRALACQPRTGAVLAAIERLAKAAHETAPLVEAYKQLASASDGAQRAYWRSRLSELGFVGPIALDDTDWGDMLDESAPSGPERPVAESAGGAAAPVSADGTSADAPTRRAAPPVSDAVEPAHGIEEAILRATPAFGIPILQLGLEPPVAAVPDTLPPAGAPDIPEPPAEPAAPQPVEPPPGPEPEPRLALPPAQPEPEPRLALPPAQPEPEPPSMPEHEPEPPRAPAPPPLPEPEPPSVPEHEPEPPSEPIVPVATSPSRPSEIVFLEPEVAPHGAAEPTVSPDEHFFKDVSWLDDEVEMIIEYPPSPEAVAAAAPTPQPDATPTPAVDAAPTPEPPAAPTPEPPAAPTPEPSAAPTPEPSAAPTPEPPAAPTPEPQAAPAEAPGRPEVVVGEPPDLRQAQDRLAADVTDLEALRALAAHWRSTGHAVSAWVADAMLSVCDSAITPRIPAAPAAAPTSSVLSRCGPWEARAMHRAMAVVWEHCASTFAEELPAAVRPSHQVSPLGADTLARGIADCSDKLAFFRFQVYRQAGESDVAIVRTRPPSVLVGPGFDPASPPGLTRLAVGVARCVPEHLLPSTLAPAEREALVQGLLCAFGPPGCVPKIAQRAATVAQDLWHFVPPRVQSVLRVDLAKADAADSGAWLTEVHVRSLLLGVRVSRDLRTAMRLGLALDAAVPPDRTLSETALRDALRWSSITRRLMRAVLSEGFQQGFGG